MPFTDVPILFVSTSNKTVGSWSNNVSYIMNITKVNIIFITKPHSLCFSPICHNM
jgi:hypothetical protein